MHKSIAVSVHQDHIAQRSFHDLVGFEPEISNVANR